MLVLTRVVIPPQAGKAESRILGLDSAAVTFLAGMGQQEALEALRCLADCDLDTVEDVSDHFMTLAKPLGLPEPGLGPTPHLPPFIPSPMLPHALHLPFLHVQNALPAKSVTYS